MKILQNHLVRTILLFMGFVALAGMTAYMIRTDDDPLVAQRKAEYEARRWELKGAYLNQTFRLRLWGTIGILSVLAASALIVATGIHRANVRKASIFYAKIGKSDIPVHIRQIEKGTLQEELKTLAHAEELKQSNKGLEKAWEIHCALADLETQRIRALASSYKTHASGHTALPAATQDALPIPTMTMQELLSSGALHPGSPIPFGHLSALADEIISIGVAGNQGSGKSNVIAALTGSLMYATGAEAYIIDPHKGNPKGVSSLLTPLEQTGRLHVFTPFDVAPIVDKLDHLLNDRLDGSTPCEPQVLLVIDELPRLSRSDVWQSLTDLLVRLVTEARKAGITFVGASHIWTGKYFNGKSEIRKCLNSTLILPTKPSQADLLLEDAKEKALVKSLHEPGQGLLSLNMQSPELIRMPFCTQTDLQTIADKLSHREPVIDIDSETLLTKEELKAGRKRLNLSQSEFGAKVGLDQKTISRLEKGESDIIKLEPDTLDKILDVLDNVDSTSPHVIDFASKARAKAV